jgi:hypothetical protein
MVALYDLSGNYVGEGPMPNYGGATPQGTKRDRGDVPAAFNSNSEPWPGAIDQTAYKSQSGGLTSRQVQTVAVDPFTGNPIISGSGGTRPADVIQNIPAPQVASAPKYSPLDTVQPLDINNLGLTRDSFFAKPESSAERAINEVTINGSMPPTGGANRGRPTLGGMRFSPFAPPGPAPEGDPWGVSSGGDLRIGPSGPPRQGMVTANRSAVAGALADRGPQPNQSAVAQALAFRPVAEGAQLAAMQAAAPQAQDPALAAALAAGNKSYVPTNGDPTGVLGYGALMPTVAMNGNPIRNR